MVPARRLFTAGALRVRFGLQLALVQGAVHAAFLGEQRGVGALLHHGAVVEHQNVVGEADGRHAVRDNEARAPAHHPAHILQNCVLGAGIADGDLDLLTANRADSTLSVRLNDGTGAFSGTFDHHVGTEPVGVALGDVDADGDLDALVLNNGSATVSVCLNDSTGTFSSLADVGVGARPWDVTLGDIDNDGDLDLITANDGGNTVSVRFNDGTGLPLGPTLVPKAAPVFSLAPNPASTQVRITGTEAHQLITLLDVTGRVVRTSNEQQETRKLDLRGLPAGMYVVRAGAQVRRLVVGNQRILSNSQRPAGITCRPFLWAGGSRNRDKKNRHYPQNGDKRG